MNVINYRVSLDMFDTLSQITIKAKKGDSACKINITLTENGKIYKIGEGCYATFNAKKSDGTFVYDNCTIEGNTIVYDFSASIDEGVCQISACEGAVECEVTLYNNDGNQLTSPCFTLMIDGTVYNGEEIVSSPESDVLRELIIEANNVVGDIETKLANGELKGEKGEKGDAGAITFKIVPELPTTDIDEGAIYLVPSQIEGVGNRYSEYIYTGGTWESIGSMSVEADLSGYARNDDGVDTIIYESFFGTIFTLRQMLDKILTNEIDLANLSSDMLTYTNSVDMVELSEDTMKVPSSWLMKEYVEGKVGSIETALDSIIAIQNGLIGGAE